jgi:hypothetical protein
LCHSQAARDGHYSLRLDAALYEPAPPYGRPRKKGARLPIPQQRIDNPNTLWQRLTLPWYDHRPHELDIATRTAVWYHTGLPAVPIRFVLLRDVAGKFDPQALLSTDLSLIPEQILAFFMRRWQMEPTFRHVREHLGVETQHQAERVHNKVPFPALDVLAAIPASDTPFSVVLTEWLSILPPLGVCHVHSLSAPVRVGHHSGAAKCRPYAIWQSNP